MEIIVGYLFGVLYYKHMVNEPSGFEPLKFYCMGKNVENSYFGHLLYNPVEWKLDDEH